MNGLRAISLGVVAAGFGFSAVAAETETVRPEIGKPLQEAQKLIAEKKYRDALEKVRAAEAVKDKSAYESFATLQLRGVAAKGAGDYETAAKSFEALVATDRLQGKDKLNFLEEIAVDYYSLKDYPKSIQAAQRYFREGGADNQIHTLVAQSYYLTGDYVGTVKELQAQIQTEEKASQTPPENLLVMLADAAHRQKDDAAYTAALERLVRSYPKKDYWTNLIVELRRKPGFPSRLDLDVGRLKLAVGAARAAEDYLETAQLALAEAFPGEARRTVEKGYADGVLGTGSEAERHKRLKDLAAKKAEEDQKTLDQSVKEASAQKSGNALVNTGLDYVGYGQFDKGILLIEQGIAKGELKFPEEAKLHLGIAYLTAGQKAKAVQTFQTVSPDPASAVSDLARLWAIHAKAAS